MLPRLERLDRLPGVKRHRRGDIDRIDIAIGNQLAEVAIESRAAVTERHERGIIEIADRADAHSSVQQALGLAIHESAPRANQSKGDGQVDRRRVDFTGCGTCPALPTPAVAPRAPRALPSVHRWSSAVS